jgi:hypothetical protein
MRAHDAVVRPLTITELRKEGDEVEGEGTAELLDDGTLEIEFAYHDGDEAVLKAKRDTSSTACSHVRRQGL